MKKDLLALILYSIVSFGFCLPLFLQPQNWGRKDWDYAFFLTEVQRKTLVDFGQVPLWNPYHCGGQPLLANPHSRFFSPSFITVLLSGTVLGLKLQIFLYLTLGSWGFYLLGKRLLWAGPALWFTPLIYMYSGFFILRVCYGQISVFSMGYLPYIWYFFLKARQNHFYILHLMLLLAFIIFDGGASFLSMVLVMLFLQTILLCRQESEVRPLLGYVALLIGTFLMAGVKILPMFEALRYSHPLDVLSLKDRIPFSTLPAIFFARNQADLLYFPKHTQSLLHYGWQEYALYFSPLSLIFFSLGLWKQYSKTKYPLFLLILAFLFSLGNFIDYSPWQLLKAFPYVGNFFSLPSRWLGIVLFYFCMIVGWGGTWVYTHRSQMWKKGTILLYILIFSDLCLVNGKALWNCFPIPPLSPSSTPTIFKQVNMLSSLSLCPNKLVIPSPPPSLLDHFQHHYPQLLHGGEIHLPNREIPRIYDDILNHFHISLPYGANSSMYPALLRNCGTLNGLGILYLKKAKIPALSQALEVYSPHFWNLPLPYTFSPNALQLYPIWPAPLFIVVNQNHQKGWKLRPSIGAKINPTSDGRIGVYLQKETESLEIFYFPHSFAIGGFLTASALYFYLFILSWIRVKALLRRRHLKEKYEKATTNGL
ncbi:MAG: hypothetical protein D6805_07755 [Planctomycetota bacterium]|nr:MAG: hypothetical protein D6805_07755 [Planctomycetota bacterium]